ncbi:MAG TPA: hypothetical protein DCM31_00790 [Deferribacteraceae bacterium]|jgi:SAM-dependent methyltransferase|nr:hypothetical protein [Deferribacteraceae bacterium]
MKCPYCGSEDVFTFYEMVYPVHLYAVPKEVAAKTPLMPIVLDVCRGCGLGYNTTPPDNDTLEEIYKNYVYIKPSQGIGSTKNINIINTIKKYVKPDERLVDIGCSEGFILKNLKNEGFTNLNGVEPSAMADNIKDSDINVIRGFFSADTFPEKSVDVFTLSHVFEHFPDPFQIFKDMLKCLKDDGRIIIEVPDFEGYHHQHLFYYSPEFFMRFADDLGVAVREIADYSTGLMAVFTKSKTEPAEIKYNYDPVKKAQETEKRLKSAFEKLCAFFDKHKGKTVYWWGSGSLSIMALAYLKELKPEASVQVIDNDLSRQGNFIPGTDLPVASSENLAGKNLDAVVIASSFVKEIIDGNKKKGIIINDFFPIYDYWTGK